MSILGKVTEGVVGAAAITTAATIVAGERFLSAKRKSSLDAFGTSLYFPEVLGSEKYPYYISFSFREYQRRSIFDRRFLRDVGMIRLPVPNQLVDASQVAFDEKESGLVVGALIENALNSSNSIADKLKNLSLTKNNITAGASNVRDIAAVGALAVTGRNNSSEQVLQLAGLAQNPFLTVLFKSPTFKRHQFTWTLNPANPTETEIAYNIINKFKYHQLPDVSNFAGGSLLTYPDIVLVGLYPNDKYLYKFKPCVIESCVVNYSPEGQPAYFAMTDAPVSISLQISLLEIEYWLRGDILNPETE